MRRLIQRFYKIPANLFIIVFLLLSFLLSFLQVSLHIQTNSAEAFIIVIPYLLCFALLAARFLFYLKAKGSGWYHVFRFFVCYALICIPAALFIAVDINQGLNGLLMIPGLALEAGLLIWLLVRHLIRQWKKERHVSEETGSSYSFEKFCGDFSAGREIEFTYDNIRYHFISENGRYYFKRIIAIDPYEYEILAEAENALACIEASAVNGKKIAGFWPDVEDIVVY